MPRFLRRFLVGCISLVFAYLLVHSREPLRTTIGDPWSDANVLTSINYVRDYGFLETSFTDVLDVGPLTADSYHYTHYPPLAEITYGTIAKYLGVHDIATFRLFGIGFSALAMWLLFSYVRRLYNDDVALISAALFSTSLVWMMYADSIHQAPIMTASGFLALWGLIRVLETGLRRHYAALIGGSFACIFTSYDYWLFLPAAVLFTIYVKRGNPFARGNRHYWLLCAGACILGVAVKCLTVIGALGWHEFIADLRLQFLERSTSTHDRKFEAPIPTMIRRFTIVFTPFVWVTIGYHTWKAVRASSVTAAIKDTGVWMLLAGLGFLYVFAELAASQMLASQVMTPFYAIGSALLLVRLLDGARARWFAYAWLAFAPIWGFAMMMSTPRSNIDRDDVARVNDYMATHDRNDFMMSNILSDGHIQASFQRHYWSALDATDPVMANWQALATFEETGTDYVHAAIFTTPESRFIDKSLWPLTMPRRMWSLTGWPQLFKSKALRIIREYDKPVMDSLAAVGAKKILELSNFSLYRIDRKTVMDNLGRDLPVVSKIDFGNIDGNQFKLLGWEGPILTRENHGGARVGYSTIFGYPVCRFPAVSSTNGELVRNPCHTKLTKIGVIVKDRAETPQAQLMLRVERACDLKLTFTFLNPTSIQLSMNGYEEAQDVLGTDATFVVPKASVRAGVNLLVIEDLANVIMPTAHVRMITIEPVCEAP